MGEVEDTIVVEERIIDIEEIPGVGPSTAEKLRSAGYSTIEAIAVASPAGS